MERRSGIHWRLQKCLHHPLSRFERLPPLTPEIHIPKDWHKISDFDPELFRKRFGDGFEGWPGGNGRATQEEMEQTAIVVTAPSPAIKVKVETESY